MACNALRLTGVQFPLGVMAGAEWNILDATGARVAICASLEGAEWQSENVALAKALVELANAAHAQLSTTQEIRA